MGCGTGQIGAALASSAAARYVGIDLSVAMLAVFGRRSRALRTAADGSRPWPLCGGIARLIFLSRAAHRLDAENLGREVVRLANPDGAVCALGRVERPEGSLRRALRRELQRRLAESGLQERGGRAGQRAALDAVRRQIPGATEMPPHTVATWETEERPDEILAAWRGKAGLGGHDVGADLQRELLLGLESFARERFGALDAVYPSTETYEIAGVILPPRGDMA